jgi:hypothetical protein
MTPLELNEIAPALVAAQAAITYAAKDSTNPHFKNRYADLQSVIEAVKGPLNANGIAFLQMPSKSEAGFLSLTTMLVHKSGQVISDTATIPLPKNDPQGYGSALTYGRRYGLAAICGLFQADDDGESAALHSKPVEAVAMANKADIEAINTFASGSDTGPVIAKGFTHFGIKAAKELTATQAAAIIKRCIETVQK